ncbi:hypothetical protein MLD38_006541 [Melastoma candidum]|uniref:Uncharacterized protein n=1 Tax=Melastoma candidum TaxID=119954 RepID=A0ACB9RMS2_9MYRT|nr:hypothetical protein MLD38_006541 [Melastoma candidum]
MYARDRPFHAPRRKTPSFSSSLLEAVYRSIDESEGQDECSPFHGEGFGTSVRRQGARGGRDRDSSSAPCSAGRTRGFTSLERVLMIEEWMEKQGSRGRCGSSRINSGSSSSDSSSGGRMGACSSSETEPLPGRRKHRSLHGKPTHDRGDREKTMKEGRNSDLGGGAPRTKLAALKIYGELKKVKQPISPGGKISAFLNSIFNSGNVKKAKMCYVGAADDVSSFDHKAAALSSYSKPSMSKTPSTRKLSTEDSDTAPKRSQRSVRFYPSAAVLGDDNPEPYGYRMGLRSCPSYKEKDFATKAKTENDWFSVGRAHEDVEYDGLSCSSSDLFELGDHLIGGKYGEELPVYETTSFNRNQAIAHGFIF